MGAYILVVEDEEKLARFVELELKHEDYQVDKALDGRTALDMAIANDYDLILLDIMLPELNGLEVLRRLHREKNTPVILLTARDAVMDKVSGLDAGAVDYITKPFAIEELLARIRVALKLHAVNAGANSAGTGNGNSAGSVSNAGTGGQNNTNNAFNSTGTANSNSNIVCGKVSDDLYRWNKLELDIPKHSVKYDGHSIELTNREFIMLQVLLENMDIVLSRDTLLERVCGYDYLGETNVIDVYVRYLRSKIDEVYNVKMIQTVRGVGYVIKSE